MWAGLLAMGAFSTLCRADGAARRRTARACSALAHWAGARRCRSTPIARDTAMAVPLLTLLITALGYVNARRVARVRDVDVPIAALPAALARLHDRADHRRARRRRRSGRDYVEAIVDAVNALEADLVAITGDLVDGSVRQLAVAHRAARAPRVAARDVLRHRQPRVLLGRRAHG